MSRRSSTPVRAILSDNPVVLDPEQALDSALERMAARGMSWAPIVEDHQRIGRLYIRHVVQTYKATLQRSVHRATSLPEETILLEARLSDTSPLAHHQLKEAGLPPDSFVVSISRQGETIFPHGETMLEPGDLIMIMTDPAYERRLRAFLEGDLTGKD